MPDYTPEKQHPTAVSTALGSHELGRQVMSLRYDLVRDTLQGMLDEASRQAIADDGRGRPRLAGKLRELQAELSRSVVAANDLANFAAPWIEAELAVAVVPPLDE